MTRWLRYTPIAALSGVSIVWADPASQCHVQISSAPEDVATEIQEWVASEPRCAREIDVRVERGAFGLHIIAIDSSGHRRERVVPDAQSAAVLVVSWMADDSADEPIAAPPEARVEAPTIPDERLGRDIVGPERRHRLHVRPLRTGSTLRFDVVDWTTAGRRTWPGRRARPLSLANRCRRRLATRRREDSPDRDMPMQPSSSITDATAFGAYTRGLGPFDVRLQTGIGVLVDSRHDMMDMRDNRTTVSPELDAAALLELRLGDHWGIVGGPVLDLANDRHVPIEVSGVPRRREADVVTGKIFQIRPHKSVGELGDNARSQPAWCYRRHGRTNLGVRALYRSRESVHRSYARRRCRRHR